MHKFVLWLLLLGLNACVAIDPTTTATTTDNRPTAASGQNDSSTIATSPGKAPEQQPTPAEQGRIAIATPESVDRLPQPVKRSAAAKLRSQARQAVAEGENARAIRYLERALRIAPQDAQTYYDYASIRLKQQLPQEALQLARRGLGMHPGVSLRNDLELLVQLSSGRLTP